MNYYISDLHLFHKNVTKAGKGYDGRPFSGIEDMHDAIRKNWNGRVTDSDTVYVLGDFSYKGSRGEVEGYLHGLNGKKVLIRGNHDIGADSFHETADYMELTDAADGKRIHLVLCHYPVLFWNRQHRGSVLLYGHVHNSAEEDYFQKCLSGAKSLEPGQGRHEAKGSGSFEPKAYNVGCMQPYMGYTPRTLEEIMHGAEAVRAGRQKLF